MLFSVSERAVPDGSPAGKLFKMAASIKRLLFGLSGLSAFLVGRN